MRPWTIAVAFGLVATIVCASGSWVPSLWGDEAATVMSARRPVATLLPMLFHVDAVHGLYYLGMHGWIRLAGDSPFALRLPSAVAIGFAVAAVTLLAGRRGGPKAAVATGIVACVLPRMTYAGEEARSFAFTAAASGWLTVLLLWLIDGGGRSAPASARRTCWAVYATGLALTSYLFLYTASIAVAHLAILLISRASRPTLRAWAVATGCALLALAPLILLAYLERSQIGYLGNQPIDPPTLLWSLWFTNGWVALAAWACIALAIGSAAYARWGRAGREADRSWLLPIESVPEPSPQTPRPVSGALVGACWLILPTGTLLVVNLAFPMYTARYSTFAAPAAALLIAEGLLVLGRILSRRAGVPAVAVTGAGLLAFVAVCTPVYLSQRGPYSKNNSDWAEVSAAMGAAARPGDAVVFDESTRPSRRPRLAMHTYPAGFAAVSDPTLRTPYDRNIGWADRVYSVPKAAELGRFDGVQRVWLVENDVDSSLHHYGLAELEALGFEATGRSIPTHRTMLIELTR
ncbi:glycosyltransferase family 39 protein [Leifsonia sp. McL0607]|uniref:glycosyltransferase family 39 protein n=1 Tax=Leifsonia sp. McL0607 TaxID=3415672 RepID=UPI003CF7CB7D